MRRLGGRDELLPYYDLAGRMLGVVTNPVETAQDVLMRETAAEIGREETFRPTPVAVYFGREGEPAADPYFAGEGPDRVGCELCGECMTGCRKDAKNSLDKNYLYFAQKFGARVFAENRVVDVVPLSPDGAEGYLVRTRKTTGLFRGRRGLVFRTKGLVIAAGTLGTNALLLDLKRRGRLPNLSEHVGRYTRTNSETLLGVRNFAPGTDYTRGVAITSSVYPDPDTHLEPVRFGRGHDAMCALVAALTDGGKRTPRFLRWLGNELRHPIRHLRMRDPSDWAKETIILLGMQTLDNYFHLKLRRPWFFPFAKVLATKPGPERCHPTWLPAGNDFGRRLAKRTGGVAANVVTEVTVNSPITAHILGGCSFGPTPEEGVIDERNRVRGYECMIVCDGSQIPENLGVNPALSITAFAERAMSFIPPKKPVRCPSRGEGLGPGRPADERARAFSKAASASLIMARGPSAGGSGQAIPAALLTTAFESVTGGGKGRRPSAHSLHSSSVPSRLRRASSPACDGLAGRADELSGLTLQGCERHFDLDGRPARHVVAAIAREQALDAPGRLPDLAHPQAGERDLDENPGPELFESRPVRSGAELWPLPERFELRKRRADPAPPRSEIVHGPFAVEPVIGDLGHEGPQLVPLDRHPPRLEVGPEPGDDGVVEPGVDALVHEPAGEHGIILFPELADEPGIDGFAQRLPESAMSLSFEERWL